ncbi:MAG: hypothetical protein JNL94_04055 [Planctomycetes bacterium]|nr:hypothetical protein [Planctomycetota bacterium]
MRTPLVFVAALVSAALCPLGDAQTIVVNTAADVVDFGGAQRVANLPGPDGKVSLAEAGLASDHTPGVQTIAFQVPQSEWTMQWLYPGRAVLNPFLGFRTFDTVILDGTTQTAFTGETNPAGGAEVVIWSGAILVDNVGSTMRGFDNTAISVSGGSGNVVKGNTNVGIDVYDSPSTWIGGVLPGEGNTCGTIKLDRTNDCVVVGNTTTRVRVLGWVGGNQPATNNRVGGPTLAERNFITGYGTWSSEGYPGGITVQLFDTVGTIVENNWIGTTPDGLAQGSQASTCGVGFEGENYGSIVRNNRIAGILGHGIGPHYAGWLVGNAIQMTGTGNGVTIVGNTIGLDANGQPLGSVTGIATYNYYLGPTQNVVIGGSTPGDGNVIAGHLQNGVVIAPTYDGVRIQGNAIRDNGALGIELLTPAFAYGVSPNDALDGDVGGNGLQNFPVIQSANIAGSSLHVVGTLDSTPSTTFSIEFFASPQSDASGHGEGAMPAGSITVTTDAAGHASFDAMLPTQVAAGSFISALATDLTTASTSEFSASYSVLGHAQSWGTLGQAMTGSTGSPVLTGTGALTNGSTLQWSLTQAKPLAPAWMILGFQPLGLPVFGGTLVPSPDIVLPITTSGAGSFTLNLTVPTALPSGFELVVQTWILDAAGPAGFAASNAIAATAP